MGIDMMLLGPRTFYRYMKSFDFISITQAGSGSNNAIMTREAEEESLLSEGKKRAHEDGGEGLGDKPRVTGSWKSKVSSPGFQGKCALPALRFQIVLSSENTPVISAAHSEVLCADGISK